MGKAKMKNESTNQGTAPAHKPEFDNRYREITYKYTKKREEAIVREAEAEAEKKIREAKKEADEKQKAADKEAAKKARESLKEIQKNPPEKFDDQVEKLDEDITLFNIPIESLESSFGELIKQAIKDLVRNIDSLDVIKLGDMKQDFLDYDMLLDNKPQELYKKNRNKILKGDKDTLSQARNILFTLIDNRNSIIKNLNEKYDLIETEISSIYIDPNLKTFKSVFLENIEEKRNKNLVGSFNILGSVTAISALAALASFAIIPLSPIVLGVMASFGVLGAISGVSIVKNTIDMRSLRQELQNNSDKSGTVERLEKINKEVGTEIISLIGDVEKDKLLVGQIEDRLKTLGCELPEKKKSVSDHQEDIRLEAIKNKFSSSNKATAYSM